MNNLLEVKDLHVKYVVEEAVVHAVNGLNLKLNKGETLGLVGETGAGKTTTALSIIQLLPKNLGRIEKGSVVFGETELIGAKDLLLRDLRGNRISMIFQDPMTSLNPVYNIEKQIAEVLEIHNFGTKTEISNRVDAMLDLVGIPIERKKEFPHQFSGGMKQRVVIAMALANNPELLIADEPTTALDVTIQAQVLDMMENLKKKFNTSMLLITHDMGVVAQTCDKVAIMYAGEIIESGLDIDIFESDYHHPYTVGLFGSIPNLEVKTDRLQPIPGMMPDPTDLPEGCKFCPRCTKKLPICEKTEPEDVMISKTHMIKCHLYKDGTHNE